ncbi:MAG: c-type cytochrome [Proteobacteria bacterium]|nr:MAG: c-type cytochrome [Pseudomonadota bacterium]
MYISLKSSLLVLGLSTLVGSFSAKAADRGTQVFKLCSYCHGNQGEGNPTIGAPSIAGLPDWYIKRQLMNFRSGARGAHPKDTAGMRMYPLARTLNGESDVDAVVKHVAAMPVVKPEDSIKGHVIKGQKTFTVCATCHGQNGEGNATLNAPPLAGASDWYLVKQLQNFKHKVRAFDPARDPMGASMAPMAAGLSDEDMLNVVSYINTFKYKKAANPQ